MHTDIQKYDLEMSALCECTHMRKAHKEKPACAHARMYAQTHIYNDVEMRGWG